MMTSAKNYLIFLVPKAKIEVFKLAYIDFLAPKSNMQCEKLSYPSFARLELTK